jgi:hypothetical protein
MMHSKNGNGEMQDRRCRTGDAGQGDAGQEMQDKEMQDRRNNLL